MNNIPTNIYCIYICVYTCLILSFVAYPIGETEHFLSPAHSQSCYFENYTLPRSPARSKYNQVSVCDGFLGSFALLLCFLSLSLSLFLSLSLSWVTSFRSLSLSLLLSIALSILAPCSRRRWSVLFESGRHSCHQPQSWVVQEPQLAFFPGDPSQPHLLIDSTPRGQTLTWSVKNELLLAKK